MPLSPIPLGQRQAARGHGRRLDDRCRRLPVCEEAIEQFVEAVQSRQMRLEDEAVFAGNAMTLAYLRQAPGKLHDLAELSRHRPDPDEHRDRQAERLGIELDDEVPYHAALFEPRQAFADRRRRYAEPAREPGNGHARIGKQKFQQLDVAGVGQERMKHIVHFSFESKAIPVRVFRSGMDGERIACEPACMNNIRATPSRDLSRFVPPQLFFVASAIFHYLGPAGAVLLFAHIAPAGVAWLRIVSAALVFAAWRRPWRVIPRIGTQERLVVIALGIVLATMNVVFYFALARLPLGTVAAIEFLGPVGLAAWGTRTSRNIVALAFVIAGAALLTQVRIAGDLPGYAFAFANCALFVLYVVLGHRIASNRTASGIDLLALAMGVAAFVALPAGFAQAAPAFTSVGLLGAAVAVGVCSSVIPYVCDQLAMARLPRASFALMLSLLPATASVIGIVVLHQWPTQSEAAGIVIVIAGVALHRTREAV